MSLGLVLGGRDFFGGFAKDFSAYPDLESANPGPGLKEEELGGVDLLNEERLGLELGLELELGIGAEEGQSRDQWPGRPHL